MHAEKYSQLLESYGYQDVNVKASQKDAEALDNLKAYFWMNAYGYSFSIKSDEFVSDYDEMIALLKDWPALQDHNISEMLVNYLEQNAFVIQYIFKAPIEAHGRVKAQKNGITYTVELFRNDINKERDLPIEEDDPIEFDDEEIQEFTQKIGSYLKNVFKVSEYSVNATSDLQKVDIMTIQNNIRYFLEVQSYSFDFSWDDTNLLGKIFYCFLSGREYDTGYSLFKSHLNTFRFHIVGNVCENSYFRVYGEGAEFGVRFRAEKLLEQSNNKNEYAAMVDFDHMEGHMFEHFCAKVLLANGFEKAKVTQGSGDQGVDIIAYKDGIKYGIQCKCYSADIGNKAVQEALAGRTYYHCHIGVVLTNRYFTKSAVDLAKSTRIVLWNRDKLISMIQNLTT